MGCDIHGWVEYSGINDNDYWWGVIKVDHWIDRSYQAFSKVFGVRGEPAFAVAPNRGLPKNISTETKDAIGDWIEDAHSVSYINLEEFRKIDLSELNEDWEKLLEAMELVSKLKETKEVRLVVWFDN